MSRNSEEASAINSKTMETKDEMTPRNYQVALMEIALEKNTIIYLPTGSGKTFIAVLVLKRLSQSLSKPYSEDGKLSFILVNTVALVDQHTKCIEQRTSFKVGSYSGDMNLDGWSKEKWLNEFDKYQVIVMTVQILANLVNQGFIDLNKVNLLIFDECHRGVNDHSMRQLCKSLENVNEPPRIIGLTATLLNGNCKPGRVMDMVKDLEITYHGKVATVNGLDQVIGYSTNPWENIVEFKTHTLLPIENKVIGVLNELIVTIGCVKIVSSYNDPPQIDLKPVNKNKGLKQLQNLIRDIIFQIESLGSYGGDKSLLAHLIQIERLRKHCDDVTLYKVLNYVGVTFMYVRGLFSQAMKDYDEFNKILLFSSEKVKKLITLLENYPTMSKEELCAIIFTKRRFTAKVVYYILDSLSKSSPKFEHIKTDFVVGNNSNPYNDTRECSYIRKKTRKILNSFGNKEINVLVASNVLEEGVDITMCSLVVKFEHPEDYRSYIQSKGRARNKSSLYMMFVDDKDKDTFKTRYQEYQEVESTLNEFLIGKNLERSEPSQRDIEEMYNEDCLAPYYVNGPNSARVTSTSAISLLCSYCLSLPSDKYTVYTPEVFYKSFLDSSGLELIKVVIRLPTICPIDIVEGIPMPSIKLAKRAAALQACKLLHQCGELDDNMLPKKAGISEEDVSFLFKHYPAEKEPDAGTNKRKRLHKKVIPQYIRGPITSTKPVYLHIIEVTPAFKREENINRATMYDMYNSSLCYGIITPERVPEICDFPVFVSLGTLNISLKENYSTVNLTAENIDDIKAFNVLVYSDILTCLREFLIFDNSKDAESILIVPVDKEHGCIDFSILKEHKTVKSVMEPSQEEKLNVEVNLDTYLNKIVAPWYRNTGFYIVTEVTFTKTARSVFPNESFGTYEQYFNDKHNLQLVNPNQPLLFVKSLSKKLNCFKPKGAASRRKRDEMFEELDIHLIPELVIKQEFPASLWIQASLLPTILSRLSFLFRLEYLRVQIATEAGLGQKDVPNKASLELDLHLLNYVPHLQKKTEINVLMPIPKEDYRLPTMPAMNLNRDYAIKTLERDYPWKDIEEPKDLEREIHDVTVMDIEYYEKFISTPLKESDVFLKNENGVKKNQLALTYHKDYVLKPIRLLEEKSQEGPQLSEIYKAMTTAKANDIVNMERLETLGDSFLKLYSSIYIYLKFPKYNEGQSTTLKGRLVSNKNLYYFGERKQIGGLLKNTDLQISDWLPPGFKIPDLVTKRIENNETALSSLYHVYIPIEEQTSGQLSQATIDEIMNESSVQDPSEEGLINEIASLFKCNFVGDKQVADCVEALLGAYFQCCGISGGIKFMEWMGIIPRSENFMELLAQDPKNPILNEEKSSLADIDFHIPQRAEIEAILGYSFKNRGYLLQALTHASYSPNRITQSYEKLEFIGDAVLDFLITCHIYESCGNLSPGDLTDLRSALVNNNTFASLAVKYNFHKCFLMINSKLQGLIDKFSEYIESKNYEIDDEVLTLLTEGVDDDACLNLAEYIDVPKVLGDLFESIAGAIYLDSGKNLHTVWSIFHRLMWKELETFSANVPKNLIRRLYEWNPNPHPKFGNSVEVGKDKVMVALEFMLNGHFQRVFGFGTNKSLAKKAAAKLAVRLLG